MIIDKESNNSYPFILRKNLVLRKDAIEIIREFKKKDVVCLVLKGLYLAFSVYPEAGLRPMVDVDLLVKKADLGRITRILNELGYTEESPTTRRLYGCDATFSGRDNCSSIDIHWDLCQYERFKGVINITEDFWSRAVESNLDGLPARTLSIEDHILYVSLHYALVHLLDDSFKGGYDLFCLINSRMPDWEKIINSAKKYGIETSLYYSLCKSCKNTGLELPDFVLGRLKPCRFKKELIDYLLLRHKNSVLRYLCQALMMSSISDTFKVLWRILKRICRQYK